MYDNKTYISNGGAIMGIHYSSTKKGPFDDEHHYDQIKPRDEKVYVSDTSKTRSQQRRCILIAIIIIAILAIAIVAAVLAVTLSSESDEKEVETVEGTAERIIKGEVTVNSKTWTDAYKDQNSMEYKTTVNEIEEMIDSHLRKSEFSDIYAETRVESLRSGSVIAEYTLVFRKIKSFVKTDASDPPDIDFSVDTDLLVKTVKQIPDVAEVSASDVTKCLPNPCRNGATCESNLSSYKCTCQPGYTRDDCSEELNECVSNPCMNSATCVDGINGYTCTCGKGYIGVNCENIEHKCSSGSCYNGQCFDFLGGFACLCDIGWEGTQCDTRKTTVVSTQRTTTIDDRLTTTTREINECVSNPCKNSATCVDGINGYTCTCGKGFTGVNCENIEHKCSSEPCFNGGQCFDFLGGFYCLCDNGWEGTQCDIRKTTVVSTQRTTTIDDRLTTTTRANYECDSKPCNNGGTCVDFSNMYYCMCSQGWVGAQCEKPYTRPTTNRPYTGPTTTKTTKPYTGPTTTTTDGPYTGPTTTTTDGPYTGPTTTTPCNTDIRYDYELNGAILWQYVESLNSLDSPGYKTMQNMVLEALMNATEDFGLTLCNKYVKQFYPLPYTNQGSTGQNIGFTVVISTQRAVYDVEIQIIFSDIYLPDYFEFISFQELSVTTSYPTTAATTYPPETCSSSPKPIYSFNITYVQQFTTDLYDSSSESFRKLNQTLSQAFLEQARKNSDDKWICRIDLIRCLPVLSNLNSGSNELHVSTEVRLHVPVNTLHINTAAYYFSEAAVKSGEIFLITYHIYFTPSTTTITTTLAPQPTTTSCPFWCDFGTNCLQLDKHCDGKYDCFDETDETTCPIV